MKSRVSTSSHGLRQVVIGMTLMMVLVGSSLSFAADWPNYRGVNYDGISKETGWQSSWADAPETAWRKSLGWGFASMAVCDGRVYAMGNVNNNDVLYCYDAATGEELWKQSYPCPLYKKMHEGGPAATPTVEGDGVYVFSKNGDVLRVHAKTGKVAWHKNIAKDLGLKEMTWYFSGSPLIVDDLVILNAGTAGVALNKSDGSLAWQNGKDAAGYASPVPFTHGGKKCVLLFARQDLYCVDAATGKVQWSHPWKTSYDINSADPILVGDMVFISSGYNKGCTLLEIDGGKVKEVYNNKNMRNQCNCSVLWKGHVYGFDGQVGGRGKLACMDVKTGQIKWAQGGLGTGSLMLAGDKLVVLGEKGKLAIVDASPAGYKELASAQVLKGKCWTVPVLSHGRIYARNAAGDLVCVDVRAGK